MALEPSGSQGGWADLEKTAGEPCTSGLQDNPRGGGEDLEKGVEMADTAGPQNGPQSGHADPRVGAWPGIADCPSTSDHHTVAHVAACTRILLGGSGRARECLAVCIRSYPGGWDRVVRHIQGHMCDQIQEEDIGIGGRHVCMISGGQRSDGVDYHQLG